MSSTATRSDPALRRLALRSLMRADAVVLLRNTGALVATFLLPILILVTTDRSKVASVMGGPALLVGLAITLGLLAANLLGYALAIGRDRESGVLQRLRVTPAPTWMIMASRLGVQTMANVVATIVVISIGSIIHNLGLSAIEYVLVVLVSIIGGAVFLALGQALVALLKSVTAINAVGRILFTLLLLLGLLGASGVLGDTIDAIAQWTPVGCVLPLFAAVMNLSAWTSQTTFSLLGCLGYIVVFSFIGIRWFRWETR